MVQEWGTMSFRTVRLRPASISDAVYVELVGTLNSSLMPGTLSVVAQAITGAIMIWQTGDTVVTGILTGLCVAIGLVRLFGVFLFRRRLARGAFGVADAHRYGLRHMCYAVAAAIGIGLLIGRSLMFDDAVSSIVAIGIGFGFCNGVVVRLSLLPFIAGASLAAIGLPAMTVSFLRMDLPHVAMAVLIMLYFGDSFEMVRRTFRSTLNHILLRERYERLARIDPMTGLFNRAVLASDLPRIMAGDGGDCVAVYAIDLDHFKAANDRFGHPVGDALLKQVAARLTALSPPDSLVVRMGGDEFVLVDATTRSRDEAASCARRILESVSAPYVVAGHDIIIGVSVGVAMSSCDGSCPETLLSHADKALYQAKVARGGYVFADELQALRAPGFDELAARLASSCGRRVSSAA
jgi:diguanylate cyclase (GGDEF)-like protein